LFKLQCCCVEQSFCFLVFGIGAKLSGVFVFLRFKKKGGK
jgi:hypothetical protein